MDLQLLGYAGVVGTFAGCAVLERVLPGFEWPRQRAWRLRGVAWLALALVIATALPLFTDQWLAEHSLLDLSGLGLWGIVPGVLVYELLGYWYHRSMHEVPALWRLHQTHHAAERLDVWSGFQFHPVDYAGWTLVGSLTSVLVLGLSVEAAIGSALVLNALGMIGHTNVRTPRWLGYLVARPESHMLHHARGVHRKNYADLPVIDMIFGTFENPEAAPAEVGFWDGASSELGTLLAARDVTARAPHRDAREIGRVAA